MVKLEIGPGPKKIGNDWTALGVVSANPAVDIQFEWGKDKFPFADNSVDIIYASHVLEHVIWHKTVDALKEAYRILKPGGKIEIHVPDFKVICNSYINKSCGDPWRKFNNDGDFMTWVNGRIFTYGGPGNYHYAVFDRRYMNKCLKQAGFSDIRPFAPIRGDDHGVINLPTTGIK